MGLGQLPLCAHQPSVSGLAHSVLQLAGPYQQLGLITQLEQKMELHPSLPHFRDTEYLRDDLDKPESERGFDKHP